MVNLKKNNGAGIVRGLQSIQLMPYRYDKEPHCSKIES